MYLHLNIFAKHSERQGCDVSVKDLDALLSLLEEKKRNLVKAEAETNKHLLLDFLHCLRKKKVEELKELQADLQFINEDINSIERHRNQFYNEKEKYTGKRKMLSNDCSGRQALCPFIGNQSYAVINGTRRLQGQMSAGNLENKEPDLGDQMGLGFWRKDIPSRTDEEYITQYGLALARKRRIYLQFNDLQDCYLQKRRHWTRHSVKHEESDTNLVDRESCNPGLEAFQSVLSTFTRYSRLRIISEIRNSDIFHLANIVSSIEFDRDDELFATAGVSRRIKVYELSSVINEPAEVHCPVAEMSTRSKLSCLSWNKYMKNHIASSDYEGIVTVWDVTTRQSVMEYEEHEKRAWSVDFSRVEPSMLVSGSDDCKVKIWCTNQEASVMNIDMKANICSVKYNPGSSINIAVGSADHQIHYYDLRNTSQPLHVFSGHRKAVSYVQFLSDHELVSASTDSTLRLWDVKENIPVRTFRGHINEKNFVGLSVNGEYIACGSETNEVFVYHKDISKPMARHKFGSANMDDTDDPAASYFTSAVCWKSDNPTILAANSQGTIKVLVLTA